VHDDPTQSALARIVAGAASPFALLHRPHTGDADRVDVLLGEVAEVADLAALPLPAAEPAPGGDTRADLLVLVPYRQIAERGFAVADDGAPLLAMTVTTQESVSRQDVAALLPDTPLEVTGGRFDLGDEDYAELVRRVVTDEIGRGEGANFVLRRSFVATIEGYSPAAALTIFRRLLGSELGAYWTFVVWTGSRTLVGATPERHVTLDDGTVVMNPVSGTYRYAPAGPTVPETLRFLADRKEAEELYMVVDEELKMMAAICDRGGRVVGPFLKEMAQLAHTEYLLEGRSGLDVRDVLRATMFAPTVTGSPLESACRVIAKYEPGGRGYYSGVLALFGRDGRGRHTLDSSILIRTADIDAGGALRIAVGATLVRHSDPDSEVAETTAKVAALLAAIQPGATAPGLATGGAPGPGPRPRLGADGAVVRALAKRNALLGSFWLADPAVRAVGDPFLAGRRVLVVDAEDTFTAMLAVQLRALGLHVTVRRFDEPYVLDGPDLVLVGPGPGDPRAGAHPKIRALSALTDRLLAEGRPFVAVCLGHQVLCRRLGLEVVRRAVPHQGLQREIDLFGTARKVGFYNTFAAFAPAPPGIQVSADPVTGEVHALRGPHFRSMQFHPESVLTEQGLDILRETLTPLIAATPPATRSA
jgi:phenazine biosynthesis protein phzE